jgi:hypothetical protein
MWVRYEDNKTNLTWEKNTETGESRSFQDIHTLMDLQRKLDSAENEVRRLRKSISATLERWNG